MGTRGTIQVYLDGRQVIKQYNQWDSQPTGQFEHICRIVACGNKRAKLIDRLRHTVLMSKEETERLAELRDNPEKICFTAGDLSALRDLANFTVLANRDWGAEILDYVLCMNHCGRYGDTYRDEDGTEISILYRMVDWGYIFNEDGLLLPQEGNYRLYLTGDGQYTLTGYWHGVLRTWTNEVPTYKELEEWTEEGYKE